MTVPCLSLIQLSHPAVTVVSSLTSRIALMSMWLMSFLVFAYYTADLTSLLTVAPDGMKVDTFQDMADLGYGVVTAESSSISSRFTSSTPGDPFYDYYEKYMKEQEGSFLDTCKNRNRRKVS